MTTHNRKWVIAKIDPIFQKRIMDVAKERLVKGVDKKINRETLSIRRFTKAMTRYEPLWEILKKAEFKEDKDVIIK